MSKPKTYTAPHPVYVDSQYHEAGKAFTTSAKPGDSWEAINAGEKAAIDASDKTLDVQPSLDDLSLSELKALAATKNVQTSVAGKPLDKPGLITAIKAVDEPTL